jgi:thymidylate synthase
MLITVVRDTMPEAWEEAVIRCWNEGVAIKTQYDKTGDPPSRDCSLAMSVRDPMREPRIHRAFPAGLDDLEVYRLEVVEGVHDHWIDPKAGKWSYTYHQRLFTYPYTDWVQQGSEIAMVLKQVLNQIGNVICQLAEAPHTRRAQAITWVPHLDQFDAHCACLQRMWFRIFDDALQMNIHIRSNDAFKAGFMNMWAFIDIQRLVAEEVSKLTDRPVRVGEYNHFADSWHIYGSYFEEFKHFLQTVEKRTFEERVWRSDDEVVQTMFEGGRNKIEMERRCEEA